MGMNLLITNIMVKEPNMPMADVLAEKNRNDGRKLGADVSVSERHARLIAKYERRKNTEVIWAIKLSLLIKTMH